MYKLEKAVDRTTWQIEYTEDRSARYPLRLLVRGDDYRLWGLLPGDLHLFGTSDGAFSVLGRDEAAATCSPASCTAAGYRCR